MGKVNLFKLCAFRIIKSYEEGMKLLDKRNGYSFMTFNKSVLIDAGVASGWLNKRSISLERARMAIGVGGEKKK